MCTALELSRHGRGREPLPAPEAATEGLRDRWLREWRTCWKTSRATDAPWGPPVGKAEKSAREDLVSSWCERLAKDARDCALEPGSEICTELLLQGSREIGLGGLGLPPAGLELFMTREGAEATRRFVQEAEAFDPSISQASLLQALRNFWVFISLQIFLEEPVALTPPALGYSLLYPWTDNFLDHPETSAQAKAEFGRWLGARLHGLSMPPPGSHAAEVDALVQMVELVFPRDRYPQVHLSLQAIHAAQVRSLEAQPPGEGVTESTLAEVTVAKGGASVLADGFLVRGDLSAEQADFIFGYGVTLQLMDDLQDRSADFRQGHLSLFTQCSAPAELDNAVAGVWSFVRRLLRLPVMRAPQREALGLMLRENFRFLLVQAVARNEQAHTPAFARKVESSSPLRFEFLAQREKSLSTEFSQLAAMLRRRRGRSQVELARVGQAARGLGRLASRSASINPARAVQPQPNQSPCCV